TVTDRPDDRAGARGGFQVIMGAAGEDCQKHHERDQSPAHVGEAKHRSTPAGGRYVDAVPTLFLIVGLPGAGKTVRARALAAEHGALLMTPDAWMISLFGQSQPDGKRDLLEGHLIALAVEALRLRLNVVLDFGLWGRDERSALRWMAA